MPLQIDATSRRRRNPAWRCLSSIALLAALTLAAPLQAQVEVNFGSGEVGKYRKGMYDLRLRVEALLAEIRGISGSLTYCTMKDRSDVARELRDAREHREQLLKDYQALKDDLRRGASEGGGISREWKSYGEHPKENHFWKEEDEEVLNNTLRALQSKQQTWARSKVINCEQTPQTAVAVQPATPPTRNVRSNPLQGFTRPVVPPRAPVPDVPPPFCKYSDLWAWHDANLRPQMDKYQDAIWDLMKYERSLHEARAKAYADKDTAAMRILQAEIDWAAGMQKSSDANYWELARVRDQLKKIDCPETVEEPPKGAVDTESGFKWRVGLGVEYAGFPDFTKVAGDQYSSSGITGSTGATGFGASLGFDRGRLTCGGSYHRNRLNYAQTYNAPEVNYAVRSEGEVTGQFIDLSCGPRFQYRRLNVAGLLGMTYAINYLDATDAFSNGQIVPVARTLKDWKSNFGLRVDIPINKGFDFRFQYTGTQGAFSGDADRNNRFEFGLGYRFGDFRF